MDAPPERGIAIAEIALQEPAAKGLGQIEPPQIVEVEDLFQKAGETQTGPVDMVGVNQVDVPVAGDQEVAAGEIVVTEPLPVHGGDDISQLQGELLKGAGVFFGGQAGGFEKVVAQGEAGGDLGVKQEAVAPAGGATGLPAGQGAIGGHAGFRQAAGAEKRPAGRIAKQVGREGVEAAGGAVTRGGRGGDLQDAGRVGSRQNQGIDFVAGIARGEAGKGAGLARR